MLLNGGNVTPFHRIQLRSDAKLGNSKRCSGEITIFLHKRVKFSYLGCFHVVRQIDSLLASGIEIHLSVCRHITYKFY